MSEQRLYVGEAVSYQNNITNRPVEKGASPFKLDDFCRLCLRQCGSARMQPLKSHSTNFGSETVSFPDMLTYVYGLPSNLSEHLPQRICERCVKRLEVAYRICREFKEKETLLQRFYFNGSVLKGLIQYQNFRTIPRPDDIATEQLELGATKNQQLCNKKHSDKPEVLLDNNDPLQSNEETAKEDQTFELRSDGLFQCMMCPQMFEDRQSCREHYGCHEALRQGLYKCQFCNKSFGKKFDASRHERRVHNAAPKETNTVQNFDDKKCRESDESNFADNTTTAISFEQVFKTEEVIIKPEPSLLGETDGESAVSSGSEYIPEQTTVTKAKRQKHNYVAGPDGLFQCASCLRTFSKKKQYSEHLHVHNALRLGRYKCELCEKLFRKRYHLNRHVDTIHLGIRRK
ncbi:zinc finger protein 454-like [Topomyia yanbarensis]|uniref:zinc finger protein 454-like n=1 Tax=Topomyia yanbarensis TaxID=2498891 RepID=UPI00273A84CA|nr:zinc finger protein 454-like [Topomyia yanbarensis]